MAPGQPTYVPVDSSSGLWERLTHWASENKTVVYTIAGVGIAVTGAGVIYYLNDNVCAIATVSILMMSDISAGTLRLCVGYHCTNNEQTLTNFQLETAERQRHNTKVEQEGEEKAKGSRSQS
jgi:hypothetical protein